eukprot:SAG11_NODE_1537_length_4724_cov_4.318270_2_plen_146_part_00
MSGGMGGGMDSGMGAGLGAQRTRIFSTQMEGGMDMANAITTVAESKVAAHRVYDNAKISRTVWVGNVSDSDATEPFLEDILRHIASIEQIHLRRKLGGCPNGRKSWALVVFKSKKGAEKAKATRGQIRADGGYYVHWKIADTQVR